LQRFLDYVDTVGAGEREEWAPVQPSDADSVKVMTIHVAKGLEFDTVFVPGLAKGLLPNDRIQHNPAERARSLDFELRGDAAILPSYDGNLSAFKDALRTQEVIEERRTCYVALTRARHHLFVSGARWYGETQKPRAPGPFLEELEAWGEESGLASVDRGPEIDEDTNPLAGYREAFVRDWPGPATPDESDVLFPDGWRRAAAHAAEAGAVPDALVETLSPDDRLAYRALATERRSLATHLVALEASTDDRAYVPSTVSVGGLVDYGRCPKRFYWSSVRPLPRFAGPAARIGTEIHRWIELRSHGQGSLLEADEEPDLTLEELAGRPGRIEELRTTFLESRLGRAVPRFVGRSFLLPVGGVVVSGRIDAIFGADDDGPWEVVDYKTGRVPDEADPLVRTQLDVYALACIDVWHKRPEDLKLTYLYLSSGRERSYTVDDVGAIRDRVAGWIRSIEANAFEPTPGEPCRWCDFRPFCDAGRAWVEERERDG
jgi:DNA helicase-2/ATP-dependent DNA helicase PcrA